MLIQIVSLQTLPLVGRVGRASGRGGWREVLIGSEDCRVSKKIRAAHHKTLAAALLREGIDTMLSGDVDAGKSILRDYIKATVGFEKLGEATATPAKSLIRMFGPRGNPQARYLFGVIGYLQKEAGVELRVGLWATNVFVLGFR